MGPIGDYDDDTQPVKLNSSLDYWENETQPYDSEELKDKDFDESQFQQCTLPMVETVQIEDALETQAINLAGEIQVLDDPDGVAKLGAQLLGDCDYEFVDSHGEGSDKTEVLDDYVELSDDDSVKRVGDCLLDQENKLFSSISKQDVRGFDADLEIERLPLTLNPIYVQRLEKAGVVGFERTAKERILEASYFEIDITQFRAAMSNVLTVYLTYKYLEAGKMTLTQVTAELKKMVPICVDACMTALYSKLRTIHKQYGKYNTRFTAPPSYTKDIELPLPFSDAIHNFGVFETRCMENNTLMVPVYPEGTRHEGCSKEEWHAYQYEAYVPILKSMGVPVKSVDTRVKIGSAWWTYKVVKNEDNYDFTCCLPFQHYSDYSATLASVFLVVDNDKDMEPIPIVKLDDVKTNYGVRLRNVPDGIQLRCFSALCRAPREEWISAANMF